MKRLLLFLSSFVIAVALAAVLYFSLSGRHAKLREAMGLPNAAARLAAVSDALHFEGRRLHTVLGSEKAQYLLARDYASGDFGPPDSAASLNLLMASASGGYVPAQLSLARLCFLGQGVPQDDTQGAAWVKRAAESGSSYAKALMGMLKIGGIGTTQDGDEALTWLKSSDEKEAPILANQLEKDLAEINSLPPEAQKAALEKYYARRKAAIRDVFDKLMEQLKAAHATEDDAAATKAPEQPEKTGGDKTEPKNETEKDNSNGH